MMRRIVTKSLVIAIAAIMLLGSMVLFGDQIKHVIGWTEVEASTPLPEDREVIYWANGNLDPNDNIPAKLGADGRPHDYNFGYNRYEAAMKAVEDGEVENILEWIAREDGTGDFFYSMEVDPALCAGVALYLDNLEITDDKILAPEQNLLVGERADAAHLRFLEHPEEWDMALLQIRAILCGEGVEMEIRELDNYVSSMYMVVNQLEGDKPSVIVRSTHNSSGHFIVFTITKPDGTVVEAKFRLECGYQPIDVPDWPTPDEPTPTATPTPTPTATPTPTPTTPPWDPTPTPTSTPTPTPEPKNPGDDPQLNPTVDPTDPFVAPDPENHDPDITETPEPSSPTNPYVSPTPPVATPTPRPSATPTPTPPPGTDVEGGDRSRYDPLEDITPPPVEEPLSNDPVVSEEITEFE